VTVQGRAYFAFHCAASIVFPSGLSLLVEGVCHVLAEGYAKRKKKVHLFVIRSYKPSKEQENNNRSVRVVHLFSIIFFAYFIIFSVRVRGD
jgi:hypothetical protein